MCERYICYSTFVLCSLFHNVQPLYTSFVCLSASLPTYLSLCWPVSRSSLTLPPRRYQAKVRELEEKCRSQSEQFNLLSKELEKFRLQAGKFDILNTESLTVYDSPGSPNKSLSQLLNGLAPVGKGTYIIILMFSFLLAC